MDAGRESIRDVLAQPTRAKLLEQLGQLRREASTEELAQALGLHVNGVRRHLDRMAEAGLIERNRRRQATRLAVDCRGTSESSASAFTQAMAALGFQPRLELGAADVATCRLCNCSYAKAVVEVTDAGWADSAGRRRVLSAGARP